MSTSSVGKEAFSRELARLSQSGLLIVYKQGNQTHYQINQASPIFNELSSIVKKTFDVTAVLQKALTSLLPQLEYAFIYGSLAKGEDHGGSDVDVMLVGEALSYTEIMQMLEPAEIQLQRSVNPTVYSSVEFSERLKDGRSFLSKVMAQPRIDLLKTPRRMHERAG